MTTPLDTNALMAHVKALADDIGPRPAGHPAEELARAYLRKRLAEAGIEQVETLSFDTWDTWGWVVIPGVAIALAGNLLATGGGRLRVLLGAALAAFGAAENQRGTTSQPQILQQWYRKYPGGTLLARIAPTGEIRHRVVIIGHTDSNKHRQTFSPVQKRLLLPAAVLMQAGAAGNAAALLAEGLTAGRLRRLAHKLRIATAGLLGVALATLLYDERAGYVDGANDNASAVACTLGLGLHVKQAPLEHTEVWLAFTGSEEVGLLGTHALLDRYGAELRDAWFIDLEMVAAPHVVYVTQHSGFTGLDSYTPDDESLALAAETARKHPPLSVQGRALVINEEVRALRNRGYRGICIAGHAEDGWLLNWHQYSDNSRSLDPAGLSKAAQFIRAILDELDQKA